ncbi:XRE family transcriptional regulator of biofilm formation [Salibacterium salarium]|uniref:helix-turn-helix domain-containing protein n=1 Tax=Salibacterium salarium TaxID=284579 RepID=UPI00277F922E|nr:DNA-binding anti-repressor SinI [Salibacterium salarium]MDQ0298126.1 XRE family transcriptional regulator of biofilm formation [Salibacterium salarium]
MIGERIVHYRMQENMSIHELAARTSISVKYLNDMEQNIWMYPSVQYVERIAKALDIPVQNLLGPRSSEEKASDLDEEWMEVVQKAMSSNTTKEEFKEYLELKQKEKNRIRKEMD